MSSSTLVLSKQYVESGLSVFPLKLDGSKSPEASVLPQVCDIRTQSLKGIWDPFRSRFPDAAELEHWFASGAAGIAIVCGIQSGGLEVIDFDMQQLFVPWLRFCLADYARS